MNSNHMFNQGKAYTSIFLHTDENVIRCLFIYFSMYPFFHTSMYLLIYPSIEKTYQEKIMWLISCFSDMKIALFFFVQISFIRLIEFSKQEQIFPNY